MPSPSSVLALSLLLAGPSPTLRPEALWTAWPDVRFVSTPAPCLRHAELAERIRELEARHAEGLFVEEVGRSVEGRPIHLLTLGRGPRRVLLWSQMHGDEPSATPALDRDPLLAACQTAGPPGDSRVHEIGDGRFLGAARRVGAAGHLVTAAFVASVRGFDAREWLGPEALTALGRLGVARLRWRVEASDGEKARAAAEAMEGPGRPAIEVVGTASEACLLEVAGRPSAPGSMRLDRVLDALTLGEWRSRAAGRPFADLLGPLATCPPVAAAGPALAPDGPASFLVLRPQAPIPEATGPSTRVTRPPEEELQADELYLQAVFIDGREPAADR